MVKKNEKNKNTKKKKNNKKNKTKRTPAPPGNVRPNSFVPWAPNGTHAGEGSLALENVLLPMYAGNFEQSTNWGSVCPCR